MTDLTRRLAADAETGDIVSSHPTVYVYEAPVRLWHWINASCILVLAITGFLIGTPLPSTPGEASANFLMGSRSGRPWFFRRSSLPACRSSIRRMVC